MNNIEKLLRQIFLVLIFFFIILFLYFTHKMAGFLVPIFIALFTAFLLQPTIQKLTKAGVPNWLSIVIVVFLFLLVLTFIFFILILSFQNFIYDLPALSEEFRTKLMDLIRFASTLEFLDKLPLDQYSSSFGEQIEEQLISYIQENITFEKAAGFLFDPGSIKQFGSYMFFTMAKTLSLVKNFGLYILSLIFILPGMSRIKVRIAKAFPENNKKIYIIFHNITQQLESYIVVKSLVSLLIGTLSFIICLIFGIKYALLWGFVTFLFNYIPYIGSFVAVQLPVAFSLIQYQSGVKTALLLISLVAFQIVVANLIEPKFYSRGVNLTPVVIFISLFIWGYIWGVAGVFLAVPIMSAINLICENITPLKPISLLISARKKKKRRRGTAKGVEKRDKNNIINNSSK